MEKTIVGEGMDFSYVSGAIGALAGMAVAASVTAFLLMRRYRGLLADEQRTSDLERFHCQKTAEAFFERERHFREFVEFLPQAVVESDLTGKFTYLNQKACELLQYAPEDVSKGMRWATICHATHLDRLLRTLQSEGESGSEDEYLLIRRDGTAFPALLYSRRVMLDGALAGYRGVVVDISARRRAEREVQKLAAVVQSCNEVIALATLDGEIEYLNRNGLEVLGLSQGAVRRQSLWTFLVPDMLPRVQNEVLPCIHETGAWEGELQYLNAENGTVIDMHTLCFIVRDPNTGEPQYLAHVGLDISARKREERLRAVREQRVVRLNEALVALARNKTLYRGDLERSFQLITETSSRAMEVDRVGIWLRQPGKTAIECIDLFEQKSGRHQKGMILEEHQYPRYFDSINLDSLVITDDVLNDPRWAGLAETYLKPLGIRSLMFAPIQVGGNTVGLVSHASTDEGRSWNAEEQSFATAVAGLAGMIVDANERRVMESALRLARDELERRVEQRTAQLAAANEQLRQAQVELERRVEARTQELSQTNDSLRRLIAEQMVNIELANQMLTMIHPPLKRYSSLTDSAHLFATGRYLPCHASGGDHYFMRGLTRSSSRKRYSHISLKDQSGHEVGCVLRCIMTDLIHLALLQDTSLTDIEQVLGRLNDEVCASGYFGEDGYFTSINLEIDHQTLETRFVSTGHPPFLLIRDGRVSRFPDQQGQGANLPAGMLATQKYTAGSLPLRVGDRLLLYSDGVFELPKLQDQPAFGSIELQALITSIVETNPAMTISDLIAELFERFGLIEREGRRFPVLTDDIAVVGLEVEAESAWLETELKPRDHEHFSNLSAEVYDQIAAEWQQHGFEVPEFRLRLALEESLLNAWNHAHRRNPDKTIRVRRRYGNDAWLQVVDEGDGFDYRRLHDPTSFNNRSKPSGRGLFVLRMVAEEVEWCDNGTKVTLFFPRRSWARPKTAGQVRRSSLAFWPDHDEK